MDAERWRQITELFEAVLALPRGKRSTYLKEACAGDPDLRREVEHLLAADAHAESFLEKPPALADATPGARASARPARPVGAKVGKYEVMRKIGQGGFGEVFQGRDRVIRRLVAIKTCTSDDEALRRRFLREAEIAGRLDHPNVVTVYDSGFHGAVPFLVQEYLSGEDLEETVRRRRPVPVASRVGLLAQMARGLEYAQSRGVVHRDVKPSNIRVTDEGQVKILDFGIAKLTNATTRLTRTGAAMGTVAYMAPEQLRGETVDGRADVFSFGVVAYELLSYRRPFPADSNAAILYQILEKQPEPLASLWPECPPALAAVVARCLEKDAGDRYQSFTEVLADLEAVELPADIAEPVAAPYDFRETTPTPLRPTLPATPMERVRPVAPRAKRTRKRRLSPWLGAAAFVAAMGFGSWLFAQWRDREQPPASLSETGPSVLPADSRGLGRLAINARPWAEVLRIVAADGAERGLGDQRFTPLAVSLPPGDYTVTLHHPASPDPRQCRTTVAAGATVTCREEFVRLSAEEFFAQQGFARP